MAVLLLPAIREAYGIDTAKHPRRKSFDRRKLDILLQGYLPLLATGVVMGEVAIKLGSGWRYEVEYLDDDRELTSDEVAEKQDAVVNDAYITSKCGYPYHYLDQAHGRFADNGLEDEDIVSDISTSDSDDSDYKPSGGER